MKRLIATIILTAVVIVMDAQATFPYPEMPTTLTSPSERGAYLAVHYWDNYDFADTTLIDRQEIAEQGFANFIDLLPRLDSIAAARGISIFGEKAFGGETQGKVADGFETMMEHYLADPNSPMRNEGLYILFLEAQIKAMDKNGFNTSRPKEKLTTAMRNRPGTKASDLEFTTRQGQHSSLWATDAKQLLLIFYDPACDHCSEILRLLHEDKKIQGWVADGELKVLAVYTEGNRQLWLDTCEGMPGEWTVAIDGSGIVANNIYDLPAMPVFYLLDNDKKVVMKDPSLSDLLNALH